MTLCLPSFAISVISCRRSGLGRILDPDDREARRIGGFLLDDLGIRQRPAGAFCTLEASAG
jgi:hypothetical protein